MGSPLGFIMKRSLWGNHCLACVTRTRVHLVPSQQFVRLKSRFAGAHAPGGLTRHEKRTYEKLIAEHLATGTIGRHKISGSSPKTTETPLQKWSEDAKKRIYVVGANPIARLLTGALRNKHDPPPVTLIVPTNEIVEQLALTGTLELIPFFGTSVTTRGFNVEVLRHPMAQSKPIAPGCKMFSFSFFKMEPRLKSRDGSVSYNPKIRILDRETFQQESNLAPIKNLIITGGPTRILPILKALKPRLRRESTILLMVSGLASMQEVYDKVFPDIYSRPTFLRGYCERIPTDKKRMNAPSNTDEIYERYIENELSKRSKISGGMLKGEAHGINQVYYNPVSKIFICEPIYDGDTSDSDRYLRRQRSASYLREQLCQTLLHVDLATDRQVMFLKLRKFAVSSIVQPLSVIFDCPCPEIVINRSRQRTVHLLLEETADVLRRYDARLTYCYLGTTLYDYLETHRGDAQLMQVKTRLGKHTEIEHETGLVVELGRWQKLQCPRNEFLTRLVRQKSINQSILIGDDLEKRLNEAFLQKQSRTNIDTWTEDDYKEWRLLPAQKHNPPKTKDKV